MNIGNNLAPYFLLFYILLSIFLFVDSGNKTPPGGKSKGGQCVNRKKCSRDTTCLQMVNKSRRRCALRYCNRGICSQQKPKEQPNESSKAPQNHRSENKKFNKFVRVTRHYLWQESVRPTEIRPQMMNRCMNKRCRNHKTCRQFDTKCRYCNGFTRRCSVYQKQGTGSRCGNDRQCGRKNVCDIPKGHRMKRSPFKTCILQKNADHKAEFKPRPGDMQPLTQQDIAAERQRLGKWPNPNTYLTSQFIARHRKLFYDDPEGVSFLVRLPGTPMNNIDFSITDVIQQSLIQNRAEGIPVVPASMMNKYIKPTKYHQYGFTYEMFKTVIFDYQGVATDHDIQYATDGSTLMRVDVKHKDIRQVALRTGNEQWADANEFRAGAHTRGTEGVPEAIVNIPEEFHGSYYLGKDGQQSNGKVRPS